MRTPLENENLIGKVCVCSVGRPFIVTGKTTIVLDDNADRLSCTKLSGWCGLGLDGKGTTFSTKPCIIAESGQEFHDKLLHRFGGKMGYNN